jgi:peptide/nickel transport system permease protein
VLSRLIYGARTTGWIALAHRCHRRLTRPVVGIVAGFLRGWTDRILMILQRLAAGLSRPAAGAVHDGDLGANREGIILALSIAYMPSVVRVVRGTVLSLREREYIEASRVMGNSEL